METKWIDVEDELPPNPHPMAYVPYLVTCAVEGAESTAWVQRGVWISEPEGCRWNEDKYRVFETKVIAWAPLPEAYKRKG